MSKTKLKVNFDEISGETINMPEPILPYEYYQYMDGTLRRDGIERWVDSRVRASVNDGNVERHLTDAEIEMARRTRRVDMGISRTSTAATSYIHAAATSYIHASDTATVMSANTGRIYTSSEIINECANSESRVHDVEYEDLDDFAF